MKKFTLVELLMVVAILGVLLSILLPSLGRTREHTEMVVCLSNQSQLSKRIFIYAKDQNFKIPPYIPNNPQLPTGHNTRSFMIGGSWKFNRRNLSYLWDKKEDLWNDQATAQMLYCPSQENESYMFKTYADPVFPTKNSVLAGQAKRVRAGYNYNILRQEDSMLPRYERTSLFENETILLTDLFTQAKSNFLNNSDLVSNHMINSFGYTKGDGSSRIKKSKAFIQNIRTRDWQEFQDLNYMGELLE